MAEKTKLLYFVDLGRRQRTEWEKVSKSLQMVPWTERWRAAFVQTKRRRYQDPIRKWQVRNVPYNKIMKQHVQHHSLKNKFRSLYSGSSEHGTVRKQCTTLTSLWMQQLKTRFAQRRLYTHPKQSTSCDACSSDWFGKAATVRQRPTIAFVTSWYMQSLTTELEAQFPLLLSNWSRKECKQLIPNSRIPSDVSTFCWCQNKFVTQVSCNCKFLWMVFFLVQFHASPAFRQRQLSTMQTLNT